MEAHSPDAEHMQEQNALLYPQPVAGKPIQIQDRSDSAHIFDLPLLLDDFGAVGLRDVKCSTYMSRPSGLTKMHLDAVVKVYCTHCPPNFSLPWQRVSQYASTSTGFAVQGLNGEKWLLTNAHSVTYHTQVKVKKRSSDSRYIATVLSIGRECDVALLSVEDEKFWSDIVPLDFGVMPELQSSVSVVGYPIGGDSLSISAGVVSRVEMTHYGHGCFRLLALQIDAAINSGNSGGPVFNRQGQCIGIAFQTLDGRNTESIGYVIPTLVVQHFLKDWVKNGGYTGFPSLNVTWQDMESRVLRDAFGLPETRTGVLIREIPAAAHESKVLKLDDIIMQVDGVDIANDGTVPFRNGERVNFKYLVTQKFVGDSLNLQILRNREVLQVVVDLKHYQYLVPPHLGNAAPSYFLLAGLIFTPCTDPYLENRFGSLGRAPIPLGALTYYGVKSELDEQAVLLSHVLSSSATNGYEGLKDLVVVKFNNTKIRNLLHLVSLVLACEDTQLRFELNSGNKLIILDAAEARNATMKVMDENSIPHQMSKDLRDLEGGTDATSIAA